MEQSSQTMSSQSVEGLRHHAIQGFAERSSSIADIHDDANPRHMSVGGLQARSIAETIREDGDPQQSACLATVSKCA